LKEKLANNPAIEQPTEPEAETPHGRNWKLVLAYDGTDFHGWQVQPDLPTIQGSLSGALERICGERVLPQGSGRTDTGVHALGQVASFRLLAPIPPANLHRALNRALPEAIRVLSAEIAPPHFHARHSAVEKTYEYRIFREEICPPFLARYVYALNWPLNVEWMVAAASLVVGEHDFTSFAANDPDLGSRESTAAAATDCVRTISESTWRMEGTELVYRVTGNGFLHHMVRNLVGTFLEVGRGALAANDIPAILAARSRSAAGPTAPARGLVLVRVGYASGKNGLVLP
jgi:tRNA pseudouridine38-40 synthase